MPITAVKKNPEELTLEVVADFPVPVERLWDAYADPRQLERFWGPVEWPATFTRHDMFPGGRSEYVMTGPNGETSAGYWDFVSVDRHKSFEVIDGFANADGTPNHDFPRIRVVFRFEPTDNGSRLITTSYFSSADELQQLLEMGMEEGMRSAMSQIDDVVADLASFAAGIATQAQILNDTQVRTSRIVRGTVDQVWRAHTEADLVKRWMTGPDGWTMPVADIATEPGETYRYEWENEETGDRFGFTGELLEAQPPYRMVTTEGMIGMEGPPAINDLTFRPVEGGTLVTIVITYPSTEVRDMVLATGMVDGMETSYARLEEQVLAA
ncbi:MAG TPA: SRPBCC family protein [Acidimicrobiia bacterium]